MNIMINTALIAGRYVDNDHMDGDWWWMALVMAIFFVGVAALVVWLVRNGGGQIGSGANRQEPAEETLRRRLAEGSIDVEEYKATLAVLRGEQGG